MQNGKQSVQYYLAENHFCARKCKQTFSLTHTHTCIYTHAYIFEDTTRDVSFSFVKLSGTSNWVGDYFITTAGVAVVVDQPQYNTTRGNLRKQLEDVFMRDWHSPYSHFVNCSDCPHLEQDGHAEL